MRSLGRSVLVRHDADGLAADVEALEQFNDRHVDPSEGFAIADVVEIKGFAREHRSSVEPHADEVFPFFELDWRGDIRGTLATIVGGDAGVKLRTGGFAAEDFPLEATAKFLLDAASAEVH